LQGLAIRQNLDPTILVGPDDSRGALFQPFQKFGTRMALGTFFARGNDGILRSDGILEFRHRGILTALMADKTSARRKAGWSSRNILYLDLFLRVAGQQNRAIVIMLADDQGILVLCLGCDFFGRDFWPQDVNFYAVPQKALGLTQTVNATAAAAQTNSRHARNVPKRRRSKTVAATKTGKGKDRMRYAVTAGLTGRARCHPQTRRQVQQPEAS
jgi:hypothetical protein